MGEDLLTLLGIGGFFAFISNGFAAGMVALEQVMRPGASTYRKVLRASFATGLLIGGVFTALLTLLEGLDLGPMLMAMVMISAFCGITGIPLALFVARRLALTQSEARTFE